MLFGGSASAPGIPLRSRFARSRPLSLGERGRSPMARAVLSLRRADNLSSNSVVFIPVTNPNPNETVVDFNR